MRWSRGSERSLAITWNFQLFSRFRPFSAPITGVVDGPGKVGPAVETHGVLTQDESVRAWLTLCFQRNCTKQRDQNLPAKNQGSNSTIFLILFAHRKNIPTKIPPKIVVIYLKTPKISDVVKVFSSLNAHIYLRKRLIFSRSSSDKIKGSECPHCLTLCRRWLRKNPVARSFENAFMDDICQWIVVRPFLCKLIWRTNLFSPVSIWKELQYQCVTSFSFASNIVRIHRILDSSVVSHEVLMMTRK